MLSEETNNKLVSNIIKYDFCVDDCLTGGFDLVKTIQLRNDLIDFNPSDMYRYHNIKQTI